MAEEYLWFKSYPSFVPREVDVTRYSNILEIFSETVSKFKDHTAFINMDVSMTYGEVDTLSDSFAWYIQNNTNLQKGDCIAIQMPNLLQFPVVLFGCLKAGLIVVNTNPLYTPEEMKHQFNDTGVKAVIILENFASHLQEIIKDTRIETVITTRIGDMLGGLKGMVVNAVVKYVKKMVPAYSLPGSVSLKECLKLGKGYKPDPVKITLDDIAFLQYTGGTTGVAKGAELTHGNICANVQQSFAWIGNFFEDGKEVVITALPLYHIFALTVNLFIFIKCGATNVLITNPRDMKAYMSDLKKHPFSVITGVNTLFNGMLQQEEFKKVDFSKLKISVGGGMAVQDAVAREWKEVTGCDLLEGYGLSETSPVACMNPIDGHHKIGSIGLPVPNTDVKILDEDLNPVKLGERGEIAIRGPQVMKGYWNRPDETTKCFKGDYFLTGDIGVMDDDGFIRIVDRKKEMILVSGFNVYPNEVEGVIMENPKVLEVGVRGVPDEKSTEAVKAFVVKKDPSLTEEEVRDFCREKLTHYKVPKYVVFRDELPKSNVGKILRRLME